VIARHAELVVTGREVVFVQRCSTVTEWSVLCGAMDGTRSTSRASGRIASMSTVRFSDDRGSRTMPHPGEPVSFAAQPHRILVDQRLVKSKSSPAAAQKEMRLVHFLLRPCLV
jgi:hypothetical protein